MHRKTLIRTAVPLVALALTAAACGSSSGSKSSSDSGSKSSTTTAPAASALASQTGAATLRAKLTSLLDEHVYLASKATGAALRGDMTGFNEWAGALNGPADSNTADLTAAITSAYGKDVGTAFDGLWRSENHIPQFVAYTQATATGDTAGQQAAVQKLTAYAKVFGETLNSVNSNLPADAVAQDITMHATTLIAVINAQKAGTPDVPMLTRAAVAHMEGTADVLAAATVKKFPAKF
jgi:hypothetical protein